MEKSLELHVPQLGNFYVKFYHANKNTPSDPKEFVPHVDDSIELFVLEEGDVSFLVGGSLYRMSAGDVILSKPNELHNCIQHTRCVHRHFCFWFSPACDFLLSDFSMHKMGQGNLIRLPEPKKRELLSLCYAMYDATAEGRCVDAYASAVAMLGLCRGNLAVSEGASTLPADLISILKVMDEELSSIGSIKELCERLFISQSTVSRLFGRFLGVSPHVYLETRRLAVAREKLRTGESVTQTALSVGFADVSAFIRLFRQRFGITPLRYKQGC